MRQGTWCVVKVVIWPTHIARATVFRSSHKAVRVERFVPWHLKGDGALTYPFKASRSHRMKFCVQRGLGGAALNKQTAGNVSVY